MLVQDSPPVALSKTLYPMIKILAKGNIPDMTEKLLTGMVKHHKEHKIIHVYFIQARNNSCPRVVSVRLVLHVDALYCCYSNDSTDKDGISTAT